LGGFVTVADADSISDAVRALGPRIVNHHSSPQRASSVQRHHHVWHHEKAEERFDVRRAAKETLDAYERALQ